MMVCSRFDLFQTGWMFSPWEFAGLQNGLELRAALVREAVAHAEGVFLDLHAAEGAAKVLPEFRGTQR